MTRKSFARLSSIAAFALAATGRPWAQTAPLAPGQVSGAEMQAWIDADGFVVGGLSVGNGCQDLFKVGDNKYEVRINGTVRSVLYRLVR